MDIVENTNYAQVQAKWHWLRERYVLTPYVYIQEFRFRPEETRIVSVDQTLAISGFDFLAVRAVPVVWLPSLWAEDEADAIQVSPPVANAVESLPESNFGIKVHGNRDTIIEEAPGTNPPFHTRRSARLLPSGGFALRGNSAIQIRVTRYGAPPYVVGANVTLEDLPDEVLQIAFHGYELRPKESAYPWETIEDAMRDYYNEQPFLYAMLDAQGRVASPVTNPPAIGPGIVQTTMLKPIDESPFIVRNLWVEAWGRDQGPGTFEVVSVGFWPYHPKTEVKFESQWRKYQNRRCFAECLRGWIDTPIGIIGDMILPPSGNLSMEVDVDFAYPYIGDDVTYTVFASINGNYQRLKKNIADNLGFEGQRRIAERFGAKGY